MILKSSVLTYNTVLMALHRSAQAMRSWRVRSLRWMKNPRVVSRLRHRQRIAHRYGPERGDD